MLKILIQNNRRLECKKYTLVPLEGRREADKWLVQVERNGARMVNRRQNAIHHAAGHFFSHKCKYKNTQIQIHKYRADNICSSRYSFPCCFCKRIKSTWIQFLDKIVISFISWVCFLLFHFPAYACQHKSSPSLQTYNKS